MVNLVYTHRALLAFRLCDGKSVNSIDLKSLKKKAHHIGLNMSKENVAAEFAVVDSDGSGRLHFTEFYPWFVQMNISHGSFEAYRGEDVIPFKRFSMRQEKEETFELSKFLDAQEIAWQQCTVDPAKMKKEWNRLDSNGNGLVSGAEVDTWVQQHHKPLRVRAVIKQAVIQTLKSSDGTVAEYIKRDTFPNLLVNFVACMRAWIMFDGMNKSDESVGLKDKRIEFGEFRNGLMHLSHNVTEDVVKVEWAQVDSDGKGMVLFNEFSDWHRMKQQLGWFEQLRQDRMSKAAEQKQQDKAAVEAALASRIAQEEADAASRKKSILMAPFDWSHCSSRAQAKLNQSLEAQFLQVFERSSDGSPGDGLQKLWLALDNNGNGLVSKQELNAWTEKKYPMLSIGATNEAFAQTLQFDGFGSSFVKRSMFKV
jgi:Ca2+-binding EF-hand superfamily protein